MPANPEAYLLSSIVRNNDFSVAVAHGLVSDMFHAYYDEAAWIEKFFQKYRKTPSKVAFKRHFPDFPLKAADDTLHFVDEVRKSHARQSLMANMRETADLISAGDIDKAIAYMSSSMIGVAAGMGVIKDTNIITDWESIYDEAMLRKKLADENGMSGIPTGFETLDERTGGIQRGQSWIVGARLGEGKTWTLLKMAVTALMAGHSVHFSALEMSKVEVGMRVHNLLSGPIGKTVFKSLSLAQGKDFDPAEYREFLRGLKDQIKGSLTVSDSASVGATEIAAQLDRHRPDVYFLDYLTLAKTGGEGGWQDIGNFSKDLKRMAREYNVGVVSAAQLNRESGLGKGIAGAEALAMSDAIGQDADAVINLKKRSVSVVEYGLVKYRHGTAGYSWHMHQALEQGVFKEVTYNRAMDLIQKDKDNEIAEKENSR